MPRKSLVSQQIMHTLKVSARLRCPDALGAEEKTVWHAIVSTTNAAHFHASDAPLLVQYVRACVLAEKAGNELAQNGAVLPNGKASSWLVVQEKQVRAMAALAHRLRLSPQSRQDKGKKTDGPRASVYEALDD